MIESLATSMKKTDDMTDGSQKASLNENAQTSYVRDKYAIAFHPFNKLNMNKD